MHTILVVDDEKWIRTALKHCIERTGLPFCVICECANGLEALDWLKENEVDLVITDVHMPVMDGLTLVRELYDGNKGQAMVVVSGYDDFVFAQAAIRFEVRDYLLKPVGIEDMNACLSKILERIKKESKQDVTNESRSLSELTSIEQVIQFVEKSMPRDVTLNEAAAKVHLNPSYLSQMFKQKTKVNFGDYVLNLRMEEAKKLLSQTSLRITEISDRLGYTDVSYFGNAFKRVSKLTPSQYRKTYEELKAVIVEY
ncbi:response regulator [Paenibacillus sp. CGMCC 1.16610]|uniref:Response regulator n=1 Tax=Paenibacillus anseongense TaxID=2682845 RepID=A0ABW9U735_9BACL|nr:MULTISPECIES: response regulator [Paenibacillus]MBA2938987.1 response regulator [Paenibacillus sp. CGMCC 1.16610]MVQ34949.1 response regulator [Paenibacillus anseongense]